MTIERVSYYLVQMVFTLIMGRLLDPSTFGRVSILLVVMNISRVFVEGGLGQALIRMENYDEEDLSTIFTFNLLVSVGIYFIIFAVSPGIERFYGFTGLSLNIRVITIGLVVAAFGMIQSTILTKEMKFRDLSIVNIISLVFSIPASIILAVKGFGIWSLILQHMMNQVFRSILLIVLGKWKIVLGFSFKKFLSMFSFSVNILLSNLLNNIFLNILPLIIGKMYDQVQLGYYTQAKQLAEFPYLLIANVVQNVSYPWLSKRQSNNEDLNQTKKGLVKYTALILFPIAVGMFFAGPLCINLFLGRKWDGAVPLFKLLTLNFLLPFQVINLTLLKVQGRSKTFFGLEVIKKGLIILGIVITARYGIVALIIGQLTVAFIAFFLNSYAAGAKEEFGPFSQLKIMFPFILSILPLIVIMFLINRYDRLVMKLIIDFLVLIGYYLILLLIFDKHRLRSIFMKTGIPKSRW